jgi:antitoxin ParD1/3/4
MDINGLPINLEQFIRQELVKGKYESEADLVAKAVGLLRERERRIEELRQEILPALERLDRGEGEVLDVDDIKARGMKRPPRAFVHALLRGRETP